MTREEEIKDAMMLRMMAHQAELQKLQLQEQQYKTDRAKVELETAEFMKKRILEAFKGDAMPKTSPGGMS